MKRICLSHKRLLDYALASDMLDKIGQILREQGLSLEMLIESGREARGEIVQEKYGISDRKT